MTEATRRKKLASLQKQFDKAYEEYRWTERSADPYRAATKNKLFRLDVRINKLMDKMAALKRNNPAIKMISRPKGWVRADAVRVTRNKGRLLVEIRRKPKRLIRRNIAGYKDGKAKARKRGR